MHYKCQRTEVNTSLTQFSFPLNVQCESLQVESTTLLMLITNRQKPT